MVSKSRRRILLLSLLLPGIAPETVSFAAAFSSWHRRGFRTTKVSTTGTSTPSGPPRRQPFASGNGVDLLFAEQHDDDGGSRERTTASTTKRRRRRELRWNLHALLRQHPATDPQLVPLIDVYNAAVARFDTARSIELANDEDDRLPPSAAPYRRFVREYDVDLGHDGRFTVFLDDDENGNRNNFADDNPSMQADVVLSMNDPLAYLRDVLSCRSVSRESRNGGTEQEETVVFVPGPHTTHGVGVGANGRTAAQRVAYYGRVLDGLKMANLHCGTYADRGHVDLELTSDTLRALESFGLLSNDVVVADEDDVDESRRTVSCRLRARDLDVIRTVLCRARAVPFCVPDREDDQTRLRTTMMRLIDHAVASSSNKKKQSQHLVFVTYSATSIVLASALSEWKERALKTPLSETLRHESILPSDPPTDEELESLLHDSVTVVTISALNRDFTDGPAYVHVSMHDDVLASTFGPSSSLTREGGGSGRNAVHLRGISPYLSSSSEDDRENDLHGDDAHSLDACALQYLALVRRINGVDSLRDLYDLAAAETPAPDLAPSYFAVNYRSVGQLEIPPHLEDELLPSMIRATGGERFLWDPDARLGKDGVDGFDSPLPDLGEAEVELTCQFGYGTFDVIREACVTDPGIRNGCMRNSDRA